MIFPPFPSYRSTLGLWLPVGVGGTGLPNPQCGSQRVDFRSYRRYWISEGTLAIGTLGLAVVVVVGCCCCCLLLLLLLLLAVVVVVGCCCCWLLLLLLLAVVVVVGCCCCCWLLLLLLLLTSIIQNHPSNFKSKLQRCSPWASPSCKSWTAPASGRTRTRCSLRGGHTPPGRAGCERRRSGAYWSAVRGPGNLTWQWTIYIYMYIYDYMSCIYCINIYKNCHIQTFI